MSGLTALTANYTDSEDEAGGGSGDDQPSPPPQVAPSGPLSSLMKLGSPSSVGSGRPPSSAKSTPTKRTGLVSYGADDGGPGDTSLNDAADDDDDPQQGQTEEPQTADDTAAAGKGGGGVGSGSDMDLDTGEEEEGETDGGGGKEDKKEDKHQTTTGAVVEAWDHGSSQLPPEPEGMCNPALQKHITEMWNRRRETGYDMNAVIQNKKMFRNPSIYEKLIQHCGIDEHGTNFPKELYDGHLFGEESYYDQLAHAQNVMEKKDAKAREQRMKEATSRAEAAMASHAAASASAPKRKSRFDQGQSSTAAAQQAAVAAAVKTIPAFGVLKKQ